MKTKSFVRHILLASWSVLALLPQGQAQTMNPLEQGVAISDPLVVRALERAGWGLGAVLSESGQNTLLANSELKALKVLDPVMATLKEEFDDYLKTHPDVGVGMKFGKRLLDYKYLSSPSARFVLVGVVNRMDRGFVETETCGEIRLIYRLAYSVKANNEVVSSRLPVTFNLIMSATPDKSVSCAEAARPWMALKFSSNQEKPEEIAARLMSKDGPLPLERRKRNLMLRLESNLQIVRWPAVVKPDFGGHAEYLLKVFRWDQQQQVFTETVLENQIDRERLMKDPALLARFKAWITDKNSLRHLDRGTLLIPAEFLAKRAFATAPGGMARSANRPFQDIFSNDEIAKILDEGKTLGLEYIRSSSGFQTRVNQMTCTGCHATHTIAGFHFMGRDPWGRYPGNSVFVPASPHFYGDLVRRAQIVEAYANNLQPDFRRGFADRPETRFIPQYRQLAPNLIDGWGAHCNSSPDASFQDWGCAEGLSCRPVFRSDALPGKGVCLPTKGQQVGDPGQTGVVVSSAFGKDKYQLEKQFSIQNEDAYTSQPQSATPGNRTGGFPGTMIHLKSCSHLTPEAECGPLPGSKSGFNACLGKGENFLNCLRDFSTKFGLRGCSVQEPCRDDYICAEGLNPERGVCVPPYFLFQFRVDGHPLGR